MADPEAGSSTSFSSGAKKVKEQRCLDWLEKQNNQESTKSFEDKNNDQLIIGMNGDSVEFVSTAVKDEDSLFAGVEKSEESAEQKPVSLRRLKTDGLSLKCEWQACRQIFTDYEKFQKHIPEHSQDLLIIGKDNANGSVEFFCQWEACGHQTSVFKEMVRHINYHAYHGKLMAIGYNARTTLKLLTCKKDSKKRNQLPPLKGDHCCMWTGCEQVFDSIQNFFYHMKQHLIYSENHICSWAGCGATFPRRIQLAVHLQSHTGERQIACYHCGQHFSNNRKLLDHLRRQNVNPESPWACALCGLKCATEYLLNEHSRMHVSAFACALCDMSAQTPAALALHIRYRHLDTRSHACKQCDYKAVTKWDLRKHIATHNRKKKRKRVDSDQESDLSSSEPEVKKRTPRAYACHICPEKAMKVFTRGNKLTRHLLKVHGAQWPNGYSRFRYQISEDGMYRLTTTRYEVLEVSKKIVDGYSDPKESLTNNLEFTLKQTSKATETKPTSFEIVLKTDENKKMKCDNDLIAAENQVEIVLCDVDDKGNIIKSEVINSESIFM